MHFIDFFWCSLIKIPSFFSLFCWIEQNASCCLSSLSWEGSMHFSVMRTLAIITLRSPVCIGCTVPERYRGNVSPSKIPNRMENWKQRSCLIRLYVHAGILAFLVMLHFFLKHEVFGSISEAFNCVPNGPIWLPLTVVFRWAHFIASTAWGCH